MQLHYSLSHYSIQDALCWGLCSGHLQEAHHSKGCRRWVHLAIAGAEALPFIGQIASLMEYFVVQLCADRDRSTTALISRTFSDGPVSGSPTLSTCMSPLADDTVQETLDQQASAVYRDFMHHLAEFLVASEQGRMTFPYFFQIEKDSNADFLAMVDNLSPTGRSYWDYWSTKPEELIGLFHAMVGRGSDDIPPIAALPFLRSDDLEEGRLHTAFFDDGFTFFSWLTNRSLPDGMTYVNDLFTKDPPFRP